MKKRLTNRTKKIILLFILLLICSTLTNAKAQKTETKPNYDKLIKAIGMVESRHNDKAVNGVHAGFLQISKVCVYDCNKINKLRKNPVRYKLSDRFNREKSIEMFYIIQTHYNKKNSIHLAILIWAEGISAKYRPLRKTPYYKKVMKIYNKL